MERERRRQIPSLAMTSMSMLLLMAKMSMSSLSKDAIEWDRDVEVNRSLLTDLLLMGGNVNRGFLVTRDIWAKISSMLLHFSLWKSSSVRDIKMNVKLIEIWHTSAGLDVGVGADVRRDNSLRRKFSSFSSKSVFEFSHWREKWVQYDAFSLKVPSAKEKLCAMEGDTYITFVWESTPQTCILMHVNQICPNFDYKCE